MTRKTSLSKVLLCFVAILALVANFMYPSIQMLSADTFTFDASSTDSVNQTVTGWTSVGTTDLPEGFQAGVIIDPDDSTNSIYNMDNSGTAGTDFIYGIKSSEVSLAGYSYYLIKIKVKIAQTGTTANVYLNSEDTGITVSYTDGTWQTVALYVKTGFSTQKITMSLYLGDKTAVSTGTASFDNASCKKVSQSSYFSQKTASDYELDLTSDKITQWTENFDGEEWTNSDYQDNKIITNSYFEFDTSDACANITTITEENKDVYDNLTYGNANALVLTKSSDADASNNVTIKNIKIAKNGCYVLTIGVKIIFTDSTTTSLANALTISAKENDTLKNSASISGIFTYTPVSMSDIVVTKNSSDTLTNGYQYYTICISGDANYDTEIDLTLSAGTTTPVAIDSIQLDKISTLQYNTITATTSSSDVDYARKVAITLVNNSPVITNGYFNSFEYTINDSSLENYVANSWTLSGGNVGTNANAYTDYIKSGVITTENANYIAGADGYVYMMQGSSSEGELTYQSLKSASFTLSSSTYYKVSIMVNTANITNGSFVAKFVNASGAVYYSKTIAVSSDWQTIAFYIHTGSSTLSLYAQFDFGASGSLSSLSGQGTALIDNVAIAKTTEANVKTATDAGATILDYYNSGWSAYETTDVNSDKIYDLLDTAYNTNRDTNSIIGAIKKSDFQDFGITSDSNNVLIIQNNENTNQGTSTSSLAQKLGASLTANKCYKITINVITSGFDASNITGLKLALNGFTETFSNINSMSGWTTYTFVICPASATSANLTATLTTPSDADNAYAVLDKYSVEEITSTEFEALSTSSTVLKQGEYVESTDDDEEDDDEDISDSTTDNYSFASEIWFWLPTALLAIAVIIVLILSLLKKFKIKKKVKVVKKYNPNTTRDKTEIKRLSEKTQEKEITKQQEKINKLQSKQEIVAKAIEDYKTNPSSKTETDSANKTKNALNSLQSKKEKIEQNIEKETSKLTEISSKEHLTEIQKTIRKQKNTKKTKALKKVGK